MDSLIANRKLTKLGLAYTCGSPDILNEQIGKLIRYNKSLVYLELTENDLNSECLRYLS